MILSDEVCKKIFLFSRKNISLQAIVIMCNSVCTRNNLTKNIKIT